MNTFKTQSDALLICEYQKNLNNSDLSEYLLAKFEPICKKLAYAHTQKYPTTLFEDNLQNSRLGCLLAFRRYKANSSKPSTFIYSTIYHYLLSCNDEEAFVNCPTNIREVRSYIGGKYNSNPKKKRKFEKKYGINNKSDYDNLALQYSLVNPENIQIKSDDQLPENTYVHNILDNICNSMFVDSLSLECKQIADLLIQGYSQTEISEIMSKNKSTTIKQIGAKINIIRKNLVKYYHEC